MARRYYSSTAVSTTLTASLTSGATSTTVASTTGWPTSYPFTILIDPDTASEEVVEVTNVSGLTLTITRGRDGTSGVSHASGAVVKHGVSARDFDEPNAHVNTTTGAHGLDSSLWSVTSPTSFTPTWTNVTVGNGTSSGSYVRVGDLVFVSARLVFGSTTALTASQSSLTLPVTPAAFQQSLKGVMRYVAGALVMDLTARVDASTAAATLWFDDPTVKQMGALAASSTGVAGDIISINGVYLAA